jgi:hypothetical protein
MSSRADESRRVRASFAILALVLLVSCRRKGEQDGWDRYASLLTTNQPNRREVVGSYLLTQQTITTSGVTAVQGRQCRLDLQPDGSFVVTNYPTWTNGQLESFISTTGHWRCDTVGSVYDNQHVWGIRFADADHRIDLLSLTRNAAPHGLLMTYGDPDENAVMIFEKK